MSTRADHFQTVEQRLHQSVDVKRQTIEHCIESIVTAAELIEGTFRSGGKLLLCGNGASALDCQHVAAEFVSRFTKDFERPALPVIVLTNDASSLADYATERGLEGVFERQVKALGKPGDLLLAISANGDSPKIIRAVKAAKKSNMRTVALTGGKGTLAGMAHIAISVPSTDTQRIQETHLTIEHVLCELVESMVFHKSDGLIAAEVIIGRAHHDH